MKHKWAFTAPRVAGPLEHREVAEADGEGRAWLAGSRGCEQAGEEVHGELDGVAQNTRICVYNRVSRRG